MKREDFLLELGTEELPPIALRNLTLSLTDSICTQLKNADIEFEANDALLASPRRLAVLLRSVETQTPAKEITVWGPPKTIAFDEDGAPSKAAIAFASKNGLDIESLAIEHDGKAEKLVHRQTVPGVALVELLPGMVEQAIGELPIPKRMRWGDRRLEFARPVHWLVMMLGEQTVPAQLLGLTAGNQTHGHRFHHPEAITLACPADYVSQLMAAKVRVELDARREHIRAAVESTALTTGGSAVIDENLLAEVTALCEWPQALLGRFDEAFLRIPPEALIASMKEHQKYFHLIDSNNQLLPYFITVANIESQDSGQVIAGNERVIRPRLADAAFFFDTDLQTPLADRLAALETVIFQRQLGSLHDKALRISALAKSLAPHFSCSPELAERAALLAKADLTSDMVLEFDKMQGLAGAYYAAADGEEQTVAAAIGEHYQPKFAGDALPSSPLGSVVALADRIDTLVGIFGIGQRPTGSKDPFALRRASLAVLRLLIENQNALDLLPLLEQATSLHGQHLSETDVVAKVLNYMRDRLRAWYEDEGISVDIFNAVAAQDLSVPLDIDRRLRAVAQFVDWPGAAALAAANKRVANILAKSGGTPASHIDTDALVDPAEMALAKQLERVGEKAQAHFSAARYVEGLQELAALRTAVDQFFDAVMVMTDDLNLRNNRLALLNQLRNQFLQVADLSLLSLAD